MFNDQKNLTEDKMRLQILSYYCKTDSDNLCNTWANVWYSSKCLNTDKSTPFIYWSTLFIEIYALSIDSHLNYRQITQLRCKAEENAPCLYFLTEPWPKCEWNWHHFLLKLPRSLCLQKNVVPSSGQRIQYCQIQNSTKCLNPMTCLSAPRQQGQNVFMLLLQEQFLISSKTVHICSKWWDTWMRHLYFEHPVNTK